MKNIFDKNISNEVIERINRLTPESKPQWGKMSADQMLAHCNVTYEFVFDYKHKKPSGFKKLMLKTFVKNAVVSDKPYKKNVRTAPEFLIKEEKNFETEKNRLIAKELHKDILNDVYKIEFVMAYNNYSYEDNPPSEKINLSQSNIAKYSLVQTVREMRNYRRFGIKVIDISGIKTLVNNN